MPRPFLPSYLNRYALMIFDEANKTAIGGPMLSRLVSVYGNGSLYSEGTGTESELLSELLYVASLDNTTVAFQPGYTTQMVPGNGTGVALIQQLPDDTMLWTLVTSSEYRRFLHSFIGILGGRYYLQLHATRKC